MSKLKIGIIYGGRSTEHEISIRSAVNVNNFLDSEKYEAVLIGITPGGKWLLMKEVSEKFSGGQPLHLRLDASNPGLFNKDGDKVHVDLFFPVLHGTDGEDGNIQGMLNAMSLPFVGTGVLGSAVCMSKLVSKQIMAAAGIPVVPFKFYTREQRNQIDFDMIVNDLGIPFMVKAANLGSSVGVNKVQNEEDLKNALEEAFKYDYVVLLEKYIKGRELECAIIGNSSPEASLAGEIVISDKYEFYTYTAKYLDPDAVRLDVPANVDNSVHEQIQKHSMNAYKALQCEDFARVDIFYAGQDQIFINEINTIPGFTNASMFPMMWAERGVDNKSLVSKLINYALERYRDNKRQTIYKVIN